MESEIFFMINPFLHILGKAIENLGYNTERIFIIYCRCYPVLEKISIGNETISSEEHYKIFSGEHDVCIGKSSASVLSKNGKEFNKALAILWLAFFKVYENNLNIQPKIKTCCFLYKEISKIDDNMLAKSILFEGMKIWKNEKINYFT